MYQPMNQANFRTLFGGTETTKSTKSTGSSISSIVLTIIRAIFKVIIEIGRIFFPLLFNNFISRKILELLGF